MIQPSASEGSIPAPVDVKPSVRIFDWFFALRPTLIFPLITMILAGNNIVEIKTRHSWDVWLLLMASLSAIFGLGYLLNQFNDREGDRKNRKLYLVSGELIPRNFLIVEATLLGLICPILLIIAGFSRIAGWLAAMLILGGVLYNFTPFALKRTPWGGVVSGLIGGWLLIHLGGIVAGNPQLIWREIPYILAFASGCILTTLPDVVGDLSCGKRTFAVAFGSRTTILTALTGIAAAAVLGAWFKDWVITIPAVVSGAMLIPASLRGSVSLAVQANKIAIFLLSVTVGWNYPIYLAGVFFYYLLARWYYRKRLGMEYPSFKTA